MTAADTTRVEIAIFSTHADRERARPLVEAMRRRQIQVWWDADGLAAGVVWQAKIAEIVQSTPVVCFAISRDSMRSKAFAETLELALRHEKRVVPIRLEPVPGGLLPTPLSERQWIDLFEPNEVERAIDQLQRVLHEVEPPAAQGPADVPISDPPQKIRRRDTPRSSQNATPALDLLLGDRNVSETWTMTAELKALLENAARYRRTAGNEGDFPVSFRTTLMGIFYGAGGWSQWAVGLAENTGFDRPALGALPAAELPVPSPLRTTTSVARLLGTAREYARRAGTMLDVHHLIGAVVFAPAGHEGELASYGFEKLAWANALVQEVEARFPRDGDTFRRLRDDAFPVSNAPADVPSEVVQESAPDLSHVTPGAGGTAAGPAWWSAAADKLKSALAWAAGAADDGKGQPIGRREIFGALVHDSGDIFADRLAAAGAFGATNPNHPPGAMLLEKLSLSAPANHSPLAAAPAVAPEVETALARALAMRAKKDDPLTPALVFLALFKPDVAAERAVVDPLLEQLGVDAEKFLESLQAGFDELKRPRESALVREIRELRRTYLAWERPHVDNDLVSGAIPPDRDLLDARKPALRFAKLLAARDVKPPIALGLFGNWGSGKTFFMGLMRDRIADLARTGGNGYVRRVVQIEFNAWHYHDTNLWASLAVRIFEGLARELGGKVPGEVEKKRKELHQKITSSAARRDEAVEIRRLALERRTQAADELEKKRLQREEKLKQRALLHFRAAWAVVAKGERFKELNQAAAQLARNFGITATINSADRLHQLKSDVEDTRAHALGVFTAIGRRFHGYDATGATVAGLVLLVLVALALGWGVEWLDRLKELNLPRFSGTLVQVATLISAVAAWCGCRVRELRGALDTIKEVEADLATAERDLTPDDALKKLEAEIAGLDQEIHKKTEEVNAAEREIAVATAEIDRINRGGLVYDFLQERSASLSYVGQLGLISTIRQDFERLDELLHDFVAHGENPIERIILYIDDLDRCHPDKVVEVLQAVHLLLAFDLFNVVVGVDARWLERSLYRQYVGDNKDGQPRPVDVFSPQDYLEKIFQIPYALAPMGKTSFKSLVAGMIETRTEWREKERNKELERERARARELAKAEAGDSPPAAKRDEADVGNRKDAETETRSEPDAKEGSTGQNGEVQPDANASSETVLFFEDHEQAFMELLHEFIDRPRLAKRFINIYRLLRVRADDEQESATFAASPRSQDFRAALTLLAIQVGHPSVALKVTQALQAASDEGAWLPLCADLASGKSDVIVCNEREREELASVARKLRAFAAELPPTNEPYRRWALRVGCFSFDWHRSAVKVATGGSEAGSEKNNGSNGGPGGKRKP